MSRNWAWYYPRWQLIDHRYAQSRFLFLDYSSYHRTDLQDLGIYEGAVELWNVRSEKDWDELSGKEVEWATRLCYTEEVWNGLTLGTW